MKLSDRAWSAGIFDGEGSVYLERNSRSYRLTVVVTQAGNDRPAMLAKLHSIFGGSFTRGEKPKKPTHRQTWRWVVSCRKAETFLREILPFVVAKRDQVEVAIRTRSMSLGDREGAFHELRAMKRQ